MSRSVMPSDAYTTKKKIEKQKIEKTNKTNHFSFEKSYHD